MKPIQSLALISTLTASTTSPLWNSFSHEYDTPSTINATHFVLTKKGRFLHNEECNTLNCWVQDTTNNKWFYPGPDAAFVTNTWILDTGAWYYAGADGALLTNTWFYEDGQWYYLDNSGRHIRTTSKDPFPSFTGWKKIKNQWYFRNANGTLKKNAWLKQSGKWYYFNADGSMMSDAWILQSGKWYYLQKDGTLAQNQLIYYMYSTYYASSDGSIYMNRAWSENGIMHVANPYGEIHNMPV